MAVLPLPAMVRFELARAGGVVLLVLTSCAPASAVYDLDGRPVDPPSPAPGELVVLVFLDPECPLSSEAAPELGRIARELAAAPVRFRPVYADPALDADAVRAHVARFALPGEALLDPGHALVERVGATVTPEAALIGAGGEVLYRGRIDDRVEAVGVERPAATRRLLRDAIQAALAGRAPDPARTEPVGCFLADLGARTP